MIALLPLRSWAGDSITVQLAAQVTAQVAISSIAIKSGAAGANNTSALATFDHHKAGDADCHQALAAQGGGTDLAHQAHGSDGDSDSDSDSTGHTCQACQACHMTALLPAMLLVPAAANPSQLCSIRTVFTSAIAALGQKPPIA